MVFDNLELFLRENGYQFIEEKHSGYFGDYYKLYRKGGFSISLVRDKDCHMLAVKSPIADNWNYMDLVSAALNDKYEWGKFSSYDEDKQFLISHLTDIERMFDTEHYPDTQKKMKWWGDVKSKEMIARWSKK